MRRLYISSRAFILQHGETAFREGARLSVLDRDCALVVLNPDAGDTRYYIRLTMKLFLGRMIMEFQIRGHVSQ